MTNAVALPLLLLLIVGVVIAAGGPAARDRLGVLVTRLRRRYAPQQSGTRLKQLSRLIRDGVVRHADRTEYTVLFPRTVRVEVGPEDGELLRRHHDVVSAELNQQWSAMATREGWQIPPHIAIELVDAGKPLARPHLHLVYATVPGGSGDATWVDATPLASGWRVVAGATTLPVTRRTTLGRGKENDVVVPEQNASRRHVELAELPDGRLRVTDLGSTNGTWIDGERLTGPRVVDDATRIGLGKHYFVVVERE